MAAAAADPAVAEKTGVPQSVAREFHEADKKRGFRILREEKSHFVAQAAKGGEFKIAKSGLSGKRIGYFQSLCRGGEVAPQRMADGGIVDKAKAFAREKAGELAEGLAGAPGTPYGEAMNAVMAAGRSVLPGGGTYGEEMQRVREAREERYPGAYSEVAGVREPALMQAQGEFYAANAPGYAAPIAYHGSPHVFDKFDMSKIGTGEGAQSYGHGLYFTSKPEVAEQYRSGLATRSTEWAVPPERAASEIASRLEGAASRIRAEAEAALGAKEIGTHAWAAAQERAVLAERQAAHLRNMSPGAFRPFDAEYMAKDYGRGLFSIDDLVNRSPGSFHEVDVPDNLLDYDAPLRDQAPEAKQALEMAWIKNRAEGGMPLDAAINHALTTAQDMPVNAILRLMERKGPADVSAQLRAAGIPGHSYIGDTSGVRNYVVYDDAQIRPLGRYSSLAEFEKSRGKPQAKAHGGEIKGKGMDLKNVRLVKETDDAWHLNDGRDFRVAKKGVSKKIRDQIAQHFARGGEVGYQDGGEVPVVTGDPETDAMLARPEPVTVAPPPEEPPPVPALTGDPAVDEQIAAATPAPPAPRGAWNFAEQFEQVTGRPLTQADVEAIPPGLRSPTAIPTDMAPPGPAPELAAAHVSPPPGSPEAFPAPAVPAAAPSMTLGAAGAAPGVVTTQREIGDAYRKAMAAEQAKADVAKQEAAATLAAQQQNEARRQELTATWQKTWQDWQRRGQEIQRSIMEQKIEPNRFWNTRTTGQKVSAAIGLILGGMGSGLTRTPNTAIQVIQSAIDRDLDAQKLELGKKQTLLGFHVQEGHSLQASYQLARADMLDAAAANLSMVATRYAGEKAQATAQGSIAALQQQAAIARQQVAAQGLDMALKGIQIQQAQESMAVSRLQRQALASLAGGGADARLIAMMPKDVQERIVVTPENRPVLMPTKEEAAKVRDQIAGLLETKAAVADMRLQRKRQGRAWLPFTAEGAAGESMRRRMIGSLRLAVVGPGAMNESELKILEALIPEPGEIIRTDAAFEAKMKAIEQMAQDKVYSALRGRGGDRAPRSMAR